MDCVAAARLIDLVDDPLEAVHVQRHVVDDQQVGLEGMLLTAGESEVPQTMPAMGSASTYFRRNSLVIICSLSG